MTQPLSIESLKERIREFRKSRPTIRAHVPEDIWLDACVLCENKKPYLVAKELGLRFAGLKKRLDELSSEPVNRKNPQKKSTSFVDLGNLGSLGIGGGKEIHLELEISGGIKIRLQCSKFELASISDFILSLSKAAA